MREPIPLLSGMALLALAGLVIGAAKFAAPALIVGAGMSLLAFFLLISRDADIEREIDDLLQEHAREARVAYSASDNTAAQMRDGLFRLQIVPGEHE